MAYREYAGVIVVTTEGKVVLQLRDDKPTIADPGKLSLFAGAIEAGETALQAAQRELFEETTLQNKSLTFFMTYAKDSQRHGETGKSHIFITTDIDIHEVDVQEGQGYQLIGTIDELNEDNCALISYDILVAYFAAQV